MLSSLFKYKLSSCFKTTESDISIKKKKNESNISNNLISNNNPMRRINSVTSSLSSEEDFNNYPDKKRRRLNNILINYIIGQKLSNGHGGIVYSGYENDGKQRKVAIKCCNKLSSWNTETRALQVLKHKNIIKMIGEPKLNIACPDFIKKELIESNSCEKDNNGNYSKIHILSQEFAEKGDLYKFLLKNENGISEEKARKIIKPLLKALIYAYNEHGISHRDIKLENIFMMEDGTIKLGDWGLAAFNTKNRKCSSSYGTLGYMAPEILCRKKYFSDKADVWSLGVLLFCLCSGVRPYGDPDNRQKSPIDFSWKDGWLDTILKKNWTKWWKSHQYSTESVRHFSNELRDIIESMFDADMYKRITLSELLKHPWMNKK